jgi:hypothetical protein
MRGTHATNYVQETDGGKIPVTRRRDRRDIQHKWDKDLAKTPSIDQLEDVEIGGTCRARETQFVIIITLYLWSATTACPRS